MVKIIKYIMENQIGARIKNTASSPPKPRKNTDSPIIVYIILKGSVNIDKNFAF